MQANETSGQEPGGRTDIEITVCENGVVNVHRPESERAHSVMLDVLGDVVRCSCKGYTFRGECPHADAIESRPLVVSSALAAASTTQRVATDGGEPAETCAQCGRESVEEYVCEMCANANDERRDDDVSGSERADFGGGEASGMDDLGDPAETADTDGGRVIDAETCDECGLVLDDAHEQPAGYVELTTDGEALCGACADIRYDRYRGDRKTADELADDQDGDGTDTEASGTSMTRTATGWASSSTSAAADESETVDETPL